MKPEIDKKLIVAHVDKNLKYGLMRLYGSDKYMLLFAETVDDALMQTICNRPALAVFDVTLAQGGAVEYVNKINTFKRDMESVIQYPHVPAIVICDESMHNSLMHMAAQLECSEIMSKPVALNDFRTIADKLLAGGHLPNADGGSKNVKIALVVDCEPRVQKLYQHCFAEMANVSVAGVPNGMEAMQYVALNEVDLIITEFILTDMTGVELVESLQEDGIKVPIMFVSSTTSTETIQRAKELGAVDYMTKPFDVVDLKERIKKALSITSESAGAASHNESDVPQSEKEGMTHV
jgi:CheY-like chemotaxis protein